MPRWECRSLINSLGRGSHGYSYVGIDLAKNVFALHGVDEAGAVLLKQPKMARGKRRTSRTKTSKLSLKFDELGVWAAEGKSLTAIEG